MRGYYRPSIFTLRRSPRATQVRASRAGKLAQPVACTGRYERIANRSAINERAAQENLSQFNSLDFYCHGSGPGGRWFKSIRPDHICVCGPRSRSVQRLAGIPPFTLKLELSSTTSSSSQRKGHGDFASPWPFHIRKTRPESSYCTNTNTGFDAMPLATTSSLQMQGSWLAETSK